MQYETEFKVKFSRQPAFEEEMMSFKAAFALAALWKLVYIAGLNVRYHSCLLGWPRTRLCSGGRKN